MALSKSTVKPHLLAAQTHSVCRTMRMQHDGCCFGCRRSKMSQKGIDSSLRKLPDSVKRKTINERKVSKSFVKTEKWQTELNFSMLKCLLKATLTNTGQCCVLSDKPGVKTMKIQRRNKNELVHTDSSAGWRQPKSQIIMWPQRRQLKQLICCPATVCCCVIASSHFHVSQSKPRTKNFATEVLCTVTTSKHTSYGLLLKIFQ